MSSSAISTRTFCRPPSPPQPELYEPILRALVESGTALEVNTSGLRHPVGEQYPPPHIVARFHELGGRAVTIGSDAHRAGQFGFGLPEGYAAIAAAGIEALTFRRVRDRPGSRSRSAPPNGRPRADGPADRRRSGVRLSTMTIGGLRRSGLGRHDAPYMRDPTSAPAAGVLPKTLRIAVIACLTRAGHSL